MGQGNASIKNFFMLPSTTSHAFPEVRLDPDTVPPMPGGSRGEDTACGGREHVPGGRQDAAAESADGTGGGADQDTILHRIQVAADRSVREGHVSLCEGPNVRDPIKEGRENPGSSGDEADDVSNVDTTREEDGCQLAMPSLPEVVGPPPTSAPPSATSSHPTGIRSPLHKKSMIRKKGHERDSLKTLWDQVGTSVEVSTHRKPQVEFHAEDVYGEGNVDVNVLKELPPKIRKEVEAALLHAKRQKMAKVAKGGAPTQGHN